MTPLAWRGRRVFITGHTGFKGSWMCLWLQSLEACVHGYALPPPTTPSLFDVARIAEGMESTVGDVRDLAKLTETLQASAPEVVFHMAAQPLVRSSYEDPVGTYATNVMGTVNLLEAVRSTPSVRAVVVITTDKCYENREWHWGYRENEPMGGYDPYSNSKGCAELVSAAYRSSFFNSATHAQHRVGVATVRAGNVIGGGDWAKDRLIPDILACFEADRPVHIRNPDAIRPWQHVLEPLRGYLTVAERLQSDGAAFAEAFNFGPQEDDARPVKWIGDRMASLWGRGARCEMALGEHPHEAQHLKLDISKARARLDWRPLLSLRQALELIVDWNSARLRGADMRQHTLAQIASYQSLIDQK